MSEKRATKRRPPDEPETAKEALVALMRASDRCRRSFAGLLAGADLTLQQFNVLRILRGAGPEGLPTLDIAERMIEKTPGVTRLVDRLEARGLVTRARSAEDRRQVFCRISERGLDVLAGLDEPVAAADRACVADLSDDETAALTALLERVARSR